MNITEIKNNLFRDVDNKVNALDALCEMEINRLHKKYCSSYGEYESLKNKQKIKLSSDKDIITTMLKRRGYDKYGDIFTKGFLYIETNHGQEINHINIKHDIGNSKPYYIDESFVTGLAIALNYYERI